ncbi:alpha/beta hydrolase [bacterium]|nr:alpha/beta hydrolase [bacterium]
MNKELLEDGKYKYIETSPGKDVLLLLHGLLGELSNFEFMIDRFGDEYNVVSPILPIMQMPLKALGLIGMVKYIEEFVEYKGFRKVHVMGNSLGGHLAQLYTLGNSDKVSSMILTGSSGLFENAMGNTFPKRGDYEFIKKKAEMVFYDPAIATKKLVDEVYDTVNDRSKALRIVVMAKSAVRNNLEKKIHLIENPTLLVWGKQDDVTPPFVADKFNELLPNSTLYFIDKCGHAPMMERPDEFNDYLSDFLKKI